MSTTTTTVIDYIVQRLVDEGISDCFGVPGDYAFPVCERRRSQRQHQMGRLPE
jgi:TPP-dependent 2-oxoacid decarboxylase